MSSSKWEVVGKKMNTRDVSLGEKNLGNYGFFVFQKL
jgi:hypothetical protein